MQIERCLTGVDSTQEDHTMRIGQYRVEMKDIKKILISHLWVQTEETYLASNIKVEEETQKVVILIVQTMVLRFKVLRNLISL